MDGTGKRLRRLSFPRRAWRRAEVTLGGTAIVVAVVVAVGLFVVAGMLILVFERDNPSGNGVLPAFGWVAASLFLGSPWDVTSFGGKTANLIIQLLKPGSVAVLTAALTSKFFQLLNRKGSGMGQSTDKEHIVICGWSSKGEEIIKEIRGRDDDERFRPVVILAPLPSNPSRDTLTAFVKGDPTQETDLKRARIQDAQTAIILADNSYPDIDVEDMDSRTLLTTLAVESVNPNCYTCVEVVHSKNREHFRRTKADELVVSAHLTGALLANSAVAHGLSQVMGDLLTFPVGNEFYWVRIPSSLAGRAFADALTELKREHDCLPVALDIDGQYVTNPPADHVLSEGSRMLVISEREPFVRDGR